MRPDASLPARAAAWSAWWRRSLTDLLESEEATPGGSVPDAAEAKAGLPPNTTPVGDSTPGASSEAA
jgi:hypothetical protein